MTFHRNRRAGAIEADRRATFLGSYLRHGLPCVLVWCAYLVAFWPGILTEDSLEQWRNVLTAEFGAYHSPLQTMVHWVITRVWLSPVAIVLMQALMMSAAYVAVVLECARLGTPRWLRVVTTAAFAALPANGILVVTLWKDIPYTFSILFVVALSLRWIRTGPDPGRATATLMGLALVAVATFRHNGLPTVGLFLVFLLWATRRSRPALQATAVACIGVIAIQLGLFRIVGVKPFHPAYRDQLMLHQVAAALRPGTAFTREDFATLNRVMPVQSWLDGYRCLSVIPTLNGVLIHTTVEQYQQVRGGLYRAWGHALSRPGLFLPEHHACVSGMIWNPSATFYLVALEVVPNDFGIATRPLSPELRARLLDIYERTSGPSWRPLVWGPALHLAIVLVGLGCVATYSRRWLPVLPFIPALAHTAVLFVAIPSAEYRLQYPVVLTGLLTPLVVAALVRSARERAGSAT